MQEVAVLATHDLYMCVEVAWRMVSAAEFMLHHLGRGWERFAWDTHPHLGLCRSKQGVLANVPPSGCFARQVDSCCVVSRLHCLTLG